MSSQSPESSASDTEAGVKPRLLRGYSTTNTAPDLALPVPTVKNSLPDKSPFSSRRSHPNLPQNSNTDIFSGNSIVFSLAQLCSFIDSNAELQKAIILESAGYHKWRLVLHRFVVLKLHLHDRPRPLWLRFDRRPVPGLGFVLGAGITPANDQAVLSTNHDTLVGNATWETERIYEFPPSLLELAQYLPAISEESSLYKLWPENCWMFCRLIEDLLSWGDNVLSHRGKFKHAEIARGPRSRIMQQVRRIHNMVEPFSVHELLESLVKGYHLSVLRGELSVAEMAATQWHGTEDWTTPVGQSLAAKLANALAVLGSRINSKLSLTAPELFQQSIGIYRRLEKRVPGRFSGSLAGCLAWAFQGSSQRGEVLVNYSPLIEEALFLKRRLCTDNPLSDHHRCDLSVYLLLYCRAVQQNPSSFAGGAKSRVLSLLKEARDTINSAPRTTSRDDHAAQFKHTLRVTGLKQAVRQDLQTLQWQSSSLDVQVSASFDYAKQLSSNSQFENARRYLEETLPLARHLQTKRRDKFSNIMFYYLILLSTASYLSGDHEAGRAFCVDASDVLRKCSTGDFYRMVGGIETYGNQLIRNGLRDAACHAYADAAQLCLRRYNSHKFAYLQPISTIFREYAACLELDSAFEEACAVREELVDFMRIQYTREPDIHWPLLTRALFTLAPSLVKLGRLHDARSALEELISVTRTVILSTQHEQDRMMKRTILAEYLSSFGNLLCRIGDFESARDAYEEALQLTRQRIEDIDSDERRGGLVDFLDQLKEEYRRGMALQRASIGASSVEIVTGTGSVDDVSNDYWDF